MGLRSGYSAPKKLLQSWYQDRQHQDSGKWECIAKISGARAFVIRSLRFLRSHCRGVSKLGDDSRCAHSLSKSWTVRCGWTKGWTKGWPSTLTFDDICWCWLTFREYLGLFHVHVPWLPCLTLRLSTRSWHIVSHCSSLAVWLGVPWAE